MSNLTCEQMEVDTINTKYHTLNDTWMLWAHLPHDTDWSISSYKNVSEINCIESILEFENVIPDIMIKNCMIFCMRKGILPTWEDPSNRDGGSFSFKINNSDIYEIWKELSITLMTEMLVQDEVMNKSICGITVSPKKNFCILKIWMKDVDIQDVKLFNLPEKIDRKSTIFRKHVPED